jgi:ParB family chromosome partitioning protein
MARKSGLGRGLDALIGTDADQPASGVNEVPIEGIKPNPLQPRNRMPAEQIEELADSIREHGVIQPLIVTQGNTQDEYILIAGERRLVAAGQAGLETVPVIIREASDRERLELALIENLQRSDLGALEAAEAFRQLAEDFKLSHEEIAAHVGKSRSTVTNTLRLLNLAPEAQRALAEEVISEGHARALLRLEISQYQTAALDTVISDGLNVRQTEALVRKMSAQPPKPVQRPARSADVIALEDRIRRSLGTKVNLNPKKRGGTLVIHYFSNEELDAILARILGSDF